MKNYLDDGQRVNNSGIDEGRVIIDVVYGLTGTRNPVEETNQFFATLLAVIHARDYQLRSAHGLRQRAARGQKSSAVDSHQRT